MSKPAALIDYSSALKLLLAQCVVTLLLTVCVLICMGHTAALSVFIGSGIYTLANAYFSFKAFQYAGARAAPLIARSFSQGMLGKWIICITLLVSVFSFIEALRDPRNVGMLFAAFALSQSMHWLVPIMIAKTKA